MKELILRNHTNVRAISKADFKSENQYKNWKADVERFRLAISDYAVASLAKQDAEVIENLRCVCFVEYRKVLAHFTDKSADFKLKPKAEDLPGIMSQTGKHTREKGSEDPKHYTPVGPDAFRKIIEDYLADVLTERMSKTASEIEQEKQARRERKKAERKAAKEAEKAAASYQDIKDKNGARAAKKEYKASKAA